MRSRNEDNEFRKDLAYGDVIRKQFLHQSLQNEKEKKMARDHTFHPLINNNPDFAEVKSKINLPTLIEDARKELERRQIQ